MCCPSISSLHAHPSNQCATPPQHSPAGKLAGLDKKLSASLDAEVQAGSSPQELSMSPVGPLSDSASRRTLIYLILTLNHVRMGGGI